MGAGEGGVGRGRLRTTFLLEGEKRGKVKGRRRRGRKAGKGKKKETGKQGKKKGLTGKGKKTGRKKKEIIAMHVACTTVGYGRIKSHAVFQ